MIGQLIRYWSFIRCQCLSCYFALSKSTGSSFPTALYSVQPYCQSKPASALKTAPIVLKVLNTKLKLKSIGYSP
jgi:hypothetical protein